MTKRPKALIGGAVGAIAGGLLGSAQDTHQRQAWHNHHVQQQLAIQQASRTVSIDDVVQMTRNGVSDSVIINQVQTHGVLRPLSVHEIVSLHQQGVREPVISAMQRAPLATATRTHVQTYHVPRVVTPYYSPVHVVRPLPAPCYPHYGHGHARRGRWYY